MGLPLAPKAREARPMTHEGHEVQDDQQQPDAFDGGSHVFVVRMWLVSREIAGAVVEWRGVIEHLPTQLRRYLNDLAAVTGFITPYLESLGIKDKMRGRLRRWLNRRKQYWKA